MTTILFGALKAIEFNINASKPRTLRDGIPKEAYDEMGPILEDVGGDDNIPWDSWQNYEKVTVNGHEYAIVGNRLYSQHAVDRMQPSGNRFEPNVYQAGGDYGRSIASQYVEDVIQSMEPVFQPETGNYIHTSGNVQVVLNPEGAVVTIGTYIK